MGGKGSKEGNSSSKKPPSTAAPPPAPPPPDPPPGPEAAQPPPPPPPPASADPAKPAPPPAWEFPRDAPPFSSVGRSARYAIREGEELSPEGTGWGDSRGLQSITVECEAGATLGTSPVHWEGCKSLEIRAAGPVVLGALLSDLPELRSLTLRCPSLRVAKPTLKLPTLHTLTLDSIRSISFCNEGNACRHPHLVAPSLAAISLPGVPADAQRSLALAMQAGTYGATPILPTAHLLAGGGRASGGMRASPPRSSLRDLQGGEKQKQKQRDNKQKERMGHPGANSRTGHPHDATQGGDTTKGSHDPPRFKPLGSGGAAVDFPGGRCPETVMGGAQQDAADNPLALLGGAAAGPRAAKGSKRVRREASPLRGKSGDAVMRPLPAGGGDGRGGRGQKQQDQQRQQHETRLRGSASPAKRRGDGWAQQREGADAEGRPLESRLRVDPSVAVAERSDGGALPWGGPRKSRGARRGAGGRRSGSGGGSIPASRGGAVGRGSAEEGVEAEAGGRRSNLRGLPPSPAGQAGGGWPVQRGLRDHLPPLP